MKCNGCKKEIVGKEYVAAHYDTIDDERGKILSIEPSDGCPFIFCEECVLGETIEHGYVSLVMKPEIWRKALDDYRSNSLW